MACVFDQCLFDGTRCICNHFVQRLRSIDDPMLRQLVNKGQICIALPRCLVGRDLLLACLKNSAGAFSSIHNFGWGISLPTSWAIQSGAPKRYRLGSTRRSW